MITFIANQYHNAIKTISCYTNLQTWAIQIKNYSWMKLWQKNIGHHTFIMDSKIDWICPAHTGWIRSVKTQGVPYWGWGVGGESPTTSQKLLTPSLGKVPPSRPVDSFPNKFLFFISLPMKVNPTPTLNNNFQVTKTS